MKLEYEDDENKGNVLAEVFHMEGSPEEICLNIYHGNGEVTTIYYDGVVVVQEVFDTGKCSLKKLYAGDKLSITF